MGVKTLSTAESEPTTDYLNQADNQPELPTADDVLEYLIEHSDKERTELIQRAADLQKAYRFLSPLSAYYLLGQRLSLTPAEVFDTKDYDTSIEICNLTPDIKPLELTATIQQITDLNEFERKDGSQGKVCNLVLTNGTGKTTLPLWDEDTRYRNILNQGDTIRIEGGYSKIATDYCQSRFGCDIEVRVGDGQLLRKEREHWRNIINS